MYSKKTLNKKGVYMHVHDNEIKKERKSEKSLNIPPNIDYDNMNMRCLHNFNNYIQNKYFDMQTCCV